METEDEFLKDFLNESRSMGTEDRVLEFLEDFLNESKGSVETEDRVLDEFLKDFLNELNGRADWPQVKFWAQRYVAEHNHRHWFYHLSIEIRLGSEPGTATINLSTQPRVTLAPEPEPVFGQPFPPPYVLHPYVHHPPKGLTITFRLRSYKRPGQRLPPGRLPL